MLQINLLPETEKEKIVSKRASLYISSVGIPTIILIIIIAGFLFFLTQYLGSINRSLESEIANQISQKEEFSEAKNKVEEFNKISGLIQQLSQYKINWAEILSDLAAQTPSKMQITTFSLDQKNIGKINISGFADSYRTAMLFKEKLEASKQFKNPEFKTGNITESGVINFELSVELEKAKIPTPESKKQTQTKE